MALDFGTKQSPNIIQANNGSFLYRFDPTTNEIEVGCNLRRRAVVDALASGRFALKAAATVKQLCFWINQHGIVLRNPLGYRV